MTQERKMFRVEYDGDPMRCTGHGKHGQCPYLSLAGMKRDGYIDDTDAENVKQCPRHGGFAQLKTAENKRVHDYRVQQYQERLDGLAESGNIKSLRGEIAVVRMMIESILSKCSTPNELLIHSHRITSMIGQCEKLVSQCDRLETKMGMSLDKAAALAFASRIVEIVGEEIDDADAMDRISEKLIEALKDVT